MSSVDWLWLLSHAAPAQPRPAELSYARRLLAPMLLASACSAWTLSRPIVGSGAAAAFRLAQPPARTASFTMAATTSAEIIPRDVLFGNPEYASPSISPDGKLLAYIRPDDDVLNVHVRTVGKNDDRVVTDDRYRGIYGRRRVIMMSPEDIDSGASWKDSGST